MRFLPSFLLSPSCTPFLLNLSCCHSFLSSILPSVSLNSLPSFCSHNLLSSLLSSFPVFFSFLLPLSSPFLLSSFLLSSCPPPVPCSCVPHSCYPHTILSFLPPVILHPSSRSATLVSSCPIFLSPGIAYPSPDRCHLSASRAQPPGGLRAPRSALLCSSSSFTPSIWDRTRPEH